VISEHDVKENPPPEGGTCSCQRRIPCKPVLCSDDSLEMAELPKTYDPKSVEPKWYAHWLDHRDYEANPQSSKPPFSIVMPPPNITGVLTLGHVLNNTIQDVLARRARMLGFEVLWLPGVDHAGIGTQTAVEKWLRKNEGVTRHDLGREKFLQRVLEWQDKHGGIIIEQLKRLGCSADWSRQRYTLDADYVRAVQNVFVDLYNKGLIYRGRRMINWDPAAQTALSDEEVINKSQRGNLYFVRYEIESSSRYIEVATTRPETIMADTALAVHPNDERYQHLVGEHAWRPLARQKIPIVVDDAIDPEFGTGVLKVTPAHDNLDFEIGQRHNLLIVDVLTPDGRINCPAEPELHGLDRFEARKRAVELLQDRHLLAKAEPYENNVGFSDRSDVPIEPRISEQWFLRYPKTKEALAVVRDHLIRFFPAHWEKVYAQWLENIQDWCISRQVWWGHRIPAWYRKRETVEAGVSPANRGNAAARAATTEEVRVQIESPGQGWTQDPDTLDTWFSSWLWAYETMDAETRRKFYPTSVLVTGPDIIFFWVARMIIAGLEFKPGKSDRDKDNIPFGHVYFTGIIRDKLGRKMSKSLGNSPDPLELIDKYGADGLRFGVLFGTPTDQDIHFDEKNIELGRNFCTKLWNVVRFRKLQGRITNCRFDTELLTSDDKWILYTLDEAIRSVSNQLNDEYEFAGALLALHAFFWGDFCDWYLETTKVSLQHNAKLASNRLAVFDFVLNSTLRLLHPFLPFVTEELWHSLGFDEGRRNKTRHDTIMFSSWPTPLGQRFTKEDARPAWRKYQAVRLARNLRREYNIPSNRKIKFVLKSSDPPNEYEQQVMRLLLNAESIEIRTGYNATNGTASSLTPWGELYMPLEATTDPAAERQRLDKEIAKVEEELRTVEMKLANESFTERAPAAVVEEHRQRQKDFSEQLAKLKQAREHLN
jgi:valyl-tRNA synthetase